MMIEADSKVEYELWTKGHAFIKGIEDLTEAYMEARKNPDWQLIMVTTSRIPIPVTPPSSNTMSPTRTQKGQGKVAKKREP